MDEFNAMSAISEIIETDINQAFMIYAKYFGSLNNTSLYKTMSVDIFTHKLPKHTSNMNVLSNYAAIYALEPTFKKEYLNVSNHIKRLLNEQVIR